MSKTNFNLHSLTGQRLYDLSRQFNHDISEYAIREISQILYRNNVHLMEGTQSASYESNELMDNIREIDPYGDDYLVYSEAEYKLLQLLDGSNSLPYASDIVEDAMRGGYSFVENPKTPQQKEWSFTLGSAPKIYVGDRNEFLPINHPIIQSASMTGSIRKLTANTPC